MPIMGVVKLLLLCVCVWVCVNRHIYIACAIRVNNNSIYLTLKWKFTLKYAKIWPMNHGFQHTQTFHILQLHLEWHEPHGCLGVETPRQGIAIKPSAQTCHTLLSFAMRKSINFHDLRIKFWDKISGLYITPKKKKTPWIKGLGV